VTASENKEINMQNDKKIQNNPEVCKKIFNYVDKPDNYLMCKAMNVYDDRYRVNVYVKESVEDLTGHKQYIKDSYFCKYDGSNLTIVS
tara:strand:+ start:101 stop:364 length:264 start_codon:yes stop_codon:yes gene_type:complete